MDKGALDVCWDALNQAKRDQSRVQGEVTGEGPEMSQGWVKDETRGAAQDC